jgi:hypothetical protein
VPAGSLAVGTSFLAGANDNVDKAAVVLQSLASPALRGLGFILFGNFGALATHLAGTGEGAVDLACNNHGAGAKRQK